MTFDLDLFVIGGGSGGVRAARIAAGEYGARVAIAEESRMGGTCVIRGCVPKKLMVFASEMPEAAALARGYAWQGADHGRFDWQAFRGKLDRELDRLEGAYTSGLVSANVEIHHERAVLVDAHTVQLASGARFTARHILIAVGGRPALPPIPGAELGIVSDDIFTLPELPGRVLIVGSGFIACEFASILNGLGSQVVQICRADQVLRGFDGDMRRRATEQLLASGIDLRLGTSPERLERDGQGLRMVLAEGKGVEVVDQVIFATGRAPYTQDLGLAGLGVVLERNGAIRVDEWSQTSVPSIYAVGDVTDQVNLTPVAIRMGHNFADTVFGGKPRPNDLSQVASAVYMRPHEIGTIGLTEEQARARGPVDIYETSFRAMRTLFAGSEARSAMKLIVDAETDRVLGCHIFAPEAGEMIQLVAIAIGMGATKADFDRTIAVHPTLAEELVTMRKPTRRAVDEAGDATGAASRHGAIS